MKHLKALALAVIVCGGIHQARCPDKGLYLCPGGVVDWDESVSGLHPPPHCN